MSPSSSALPAAGFDSIDGVLDSLRAAGYFADRRLATAVFLALRLQRPLLLEGEPGVGKTELAKALSIALGRQLLRLQCYDGMELREALYEWNYAAQLLHMRAAEAAVRRAMSSRRCTSRATWCAVRCCRRSRRPRPAPCS